MSVLELRNLGKTFHSSGGSTTALANVNLDIEPGELFVLLGPSGCGKSTLLNLIAGLETPTSGSIRFGEELFFSADDGRDLSPRGRNIAMVFQNYALYPHLTVHDNIAFPLRIGKTPKNEIETQTTDIARMLGLSELLSSKPGQLSGGQRQRVAIARAIIRRPNLFLLDEPLSNLDAQLRASMRTEIKRLQRSLGITAVYVTHDQVEAMTLGDRVAVLKSGRIEQIAAPDRLYEQPSNTFTARFVGSPQMNIIPSRLRKTDTGRSVMVADAAIDLSRYSIPEDTEAVQVGIRPEHLHLVENSESPRESTITAKVDGVERLGREDFVHCRTEDGTELSFLSSSIHVDLENIVYLRPESNRIHVFSKDGDRRFE